MKAMILAAGRGERMRPLSDAKPKPLLEAGGKPLIVWTLERLRDGGILEVVINHAHLGAQIEEALGDGSRYGVRILYSRESEALETAGGIVNALELLGDAPFIAAAGDIYCDADYSSLCSLNLGDKLAHLLLVPNPPHHPEGDFSLDGTGLKNTGSPRHTFSGIGLYQPRLFAGIATGMRHKLAPLLRDAANAGRASGELHRGDWFDIGTPERLVELHRRIART